MLRRLRKHFEKNELVHQPLSHIRSIRLLTLLPGRFTDPIKATLEQVSLDDKPDYEALSYVWGQPTLSKVIKCNDKRKHVTKNLHDAVLHIRQDAKKRVLWIDQLCINQIDVQERNQQVSLMGDVFSNATRVIVWLGPAFEGIQLVWDLKDKIDETDGWNNSAASKTSFRQILRNEGEGRSVMKSFDLDDETYLSLSKFFESDWFDRMWCYQEFSLNQDCIVYCGMFNMDQHSVSEICVWLTFSDRVTDLSYRFGNAHNLILHNVRNQTKRKLSLILKDTSRLKVSEPRDKVYALHGLSYVNIETQYSQSLCDVYTNIVKACIGQEGTLDILYGAERQEHTTSFPTWVTDFEA